jgi:nucleotide-binding universal stress UspA family protein
MYNTILVPLDGSKRAEKILRHVEELALNNSSKLIFLQAVRLPIIIEYEEDETLLNRQELEEHICRPSGPFRQTNLKM